MKKMRALFGRKRKIQKAELIDVDVELISLVVDDFAPINGKGFIKKAGKQHPEMGRTTKYKAETEGTQGLLYMTFMEPDVVDSQGDSFSKETVRKANENFARKGRNIETIDVNHNGIVDTDFFISESYILKAVDETNYPGAKVGSWVGVIKCDNLSNPTWKKFEKGEGKGASIFGKCVEMDYDPAAILEELQAMKGILQKANKSDKNNDAIAAIDKRIDEINKGKDTTDLTELVKAFTDLNINLGKVVAKGIQQEGGKQVEEDKKMTIGGEEVVVKGTHKELYKAIANVDSGTKMNILSGNQTELFIDTVLDSQPGDTLSDISVIPLTKDEKIDKGLIDDIVLKNSADGALTAQDVSTGEISCPTSILNGALDLAEDTVEFYTDKYGAETFGAYVETKLAKKVEKALRLLLFKGDRASGTDKLKGLNGVVKLATTAVDVTRINKTTYDTFNARFEQVLLSFSDDMLEEQANMVIYVSHKDLIRVRAEAKTKANVVSGRLNIGPDSKVTFDEIPVKARFVADDTIIAGLAKFIFIGVRSDANLKVEHHGTDWKYHWYIRVRAGIQYLTGFVKVFAVVAG